MKPRVRVTGISPAVIVAAVVLLGSGCAVGPDYQPPPSRSPAAFVHAPVAGAEADEASLAEWWRAFGDPRLW